MGQEIERKFLLASDGWRAEISHCEAMRQGYLAAKSQCSIRVRIAGEHAFLNIKSATLGVARHEFEYPVPLAEAQEMLDLFCGSQTLSKVRHSVPCGVHTWEIDVFEGKNLGLVVAEIELSSITETFVRPAWLGAEVSHDQRYYNSRLIDHPYQDW